MSHTHEDCEFLQLHPHIVEQVKAELPSAEEQERLAELFRMFADPTRLRILTVLQVSDMCVCHIAEVLGMTVSAISHQLRLLKNARLVTARRVGKSMIYSLADDHVRVMMKNGTDHVRE
jgi:ArsR family transcriptional regulator